MCRICDEEIVEIVSDEPGARFIQLNECHHLVEIRGLLMWLERKVDSTEMTEIATCPTCHTPIRNSTFVNKSNTTRVMDIQGAKALICQNYKQNQQRQMSLHWEIANYPRFADGLPSLMLCKQLLALRNIHQKLLRDTEPTDGNVLNLLDLQAKENIFKMWSKLQEMFAILVKALKKHYPPKRICTDTLIPLTIMRKIGTRFLHLLNFLYIFTDNKQQNSDATTEIDLLFHVSKMLEGDVNYETYDSNRAAFEDVFQLALQVGRGTNEQLEVIKTKVHTYEMSVLSSAEMMDHGDKGEN